MVSEQLRQLWRSPPEAAIFIFLFIFVEVAPVEAYWFSECYYGVFSSTSNFGRRAASDFEISPGFLRGSRGLQCCFPGDLVGSRPLPFTAGFADPAGEKRARADCGGQNRGRCPDGGQKKSCWDAYKKRGDCRAWFLDYHGEELLGRPLVFEWRRLPCRGGFQVRGGAV